MICNGHRHVFFVDDDQKIRRVVSESLKQLGVDVQCFARGEHCLQQLSQTECDLLITDVVLPGMDGLELLTRARRVAPWLPVLLVSGYADVHQAIKAGRQGAVDFFEKPIDLKSFLAAVKRALQKNGQHDVHRGNGLTPAEQMILRFVLDGKSNRQIARRLHRSRRTIEVHRQHIMHKLDAHNLIDLVRACIRLGLIGPPSG